MRGYKHIESGIGQYLVQRYKRAVEVGIGTNTVTAEILHEAGSLHRCTDIRDLTLGPLPFLRDDLFSPRFSLYSSADLIYSLRPGIEMIPPLINLASRVNCDLIIYHLGFEIYGKGGQILDPHLNLHKYYLKKPQKVLTD